VLACLHFEMLRVSIPLCVVRLGGTPLMAARVLLTRSLPSISLRPFIGYWADGWSLAAVLTLGLILMGVSGIWYLVPVISIVFIASVARGLGWAAFMTGGYTTVAHIAPDSRRGERLRWRSLRFRRAVHPATLGARRSPLGFFSCRLYGCWLRFSVR